MADNGIYTDGFNDGRADALDEIAGILEQCDTTDDFGQEIKALLRGEGVI